VDTAPPYPEPRLLVGGAWRSRPGAPVLDPSTDAVLGTVPHATPEDLHDAVAAAQDALRGWRATPPDARAAVLLRAAALLRERIEPIATVMALEQGKPLRDARNEVLRAASIVEWDAQEARRLYGRIIPAEPGMRHLVIREPIGVVAAFSPWNAPVGSPVRKVSGALAAGCTLVLKAAEETPACAMELARAFVDAGLPAGALNLVFGDPEAISGFLVAHPAVRMVAFTGSVAVGKRLSALAGAHMKPVLMELGGHGPVIVCADADPEAVAAAAVAAKSRNAGQICIAATRFLVADPIHDRFAAAFADRARTLRVGHPLAPDTEMGPLANHRRRRAIEALVDDAVARGARRLAGGGRIGTVGCFLPLTVLADVPTDARAMQEEPFGPLALLQRWSTLDEAIALANALPLGLNAYAFTDSARLVERLTAELETGYLSINHFGSSTAAIPFGGVKDSGFGREGGAEGVLGYTTAKVVSHLAR
jgi:succinate-semialdehyde dehydrogenase/glutarate-semialdehyde dehydrogenase